ncbi:MAG: DNA polymerase III subunit delta' [Candidatus Omnitrophota bacterium]
MSFRDIRGQDSATLFLRRSIESGRISHAYLFAGPSGVGRRLAALDFAKAVNCLDPKAGASCDICGQCRKIDASNHPDVIIFSPAKADASFGIERIRLLEREVGLKPYEGRRKVYILDSADAMTQEAQNALLKTLEEPPSESVLILITESPASLFPTIQSRAQSVRFFPLPPEVVGSILTDLHKVDKDRAGILSRVSSGSVGKALEYNTADFFNIRRRVIGSLSNGAFADQDLDGFSKPELRLILDMVLTWYRDILVTKAFADGSPELVNIDNLQPIREAARRTSFGELNNAIEQVILTGSLLDRNANPKLAMSVLGMRIS